jgi:uncharacterized membrane protein YidH (DUF202 family)
MAVSLGVGKVIPAFTNNHLWWPWVALGIAFALLGASFIIYGLVRQKAVERALRVGTYAAPSGRVMSAFALWGVVLAVAVCVLISVT